MTHVRCAKLVRVCMRLFPLREMPSNYVSCLRGPLNLSNCGNGMFRLFRYLNEWSDAPGCVSRWMIDIKVRVVADEVGGAILGGTAGYLPSRWCLEPSFKRKSVVLVPCYLLSCRIDALKQNHTYFQSIRQFSCPSAVRTFLDDVAVGILHRGVPSSRASLIVRNISLR